MRTLLTWFVRLILLMILATGGTLVFFVVKDVLKELKGHHESH